MVAAPAPIEPLGRHPWKCYRGECHGIVSGAGSSLATDDGLCRVRETPTKTSARSALDFLCRFHDPSLEMSKPGKAVIVPETEGLRGPSALSCPTGPPPEAEPGRTIGLASD